MLADHRVGHSHEQQLAEHLSPLSALASFTDQDVCDYLKSCIEHSRYLSNYYTSGNWLTMEMSGLYTVGALYPELNDAAGWRVFSGQKLFCEETNQFYPDGVQKEMSPGLSRRGAG